MEELLTRKCHGGSVRGPFETQNGVRRLSSRRVAMSFNGSLERQRGSACITAQLHALNSLRRITRGTVYCGHDCAASAARDASA